MELRMVDSLKNKKHCVRKGALVQVNGIITLEDGNDYGILKFDSFNLFRIYKENNKFKLSENSAGCVHKYSSGLINIIKYNEEHDIKIKDVVYFN